MKRIYTSLLLVMFAAASFAQNILVVVKTNVSGDVQWTIDSILVSKLTDAGFTPDVKMMADVASLDLTAYDGAVITESDGSSSIAAFGPNTATLPTVCLKAYAIKKGDWTWVNGDTFIANSAFSDTTDAAGSTGVEVAADHAIFGNKYHVGDRFSFANGEYPGGAHIQTFNFDNAPATEVAAAATVIGTSVAASEGASAAEYVTSDFLFAVEENTASKRTVLWGVHNLYLGEYATEDFWWVFLNSVRWTIGADLEVVGVHDLAAGSTVEIANVGGQVTVTAQAPVEVAIYNVLGSLVASGAAGTYDIATPGVYVVTVGDVVEKIVVE